MVYSQDRTDVLKLLQILPSEMGGIPHHLIDILSHHEEFSAGDFYSLARAATADILQVSHRQ